MRLCNIECERVDNKPIPFRWELQFTFSSETGNDKSIIIAFRPGWNPADVISMLQNGLRSIVREVGDKEANNGEV